MAVEQGDDAVAPLHPERAQPPAPRHPRRAGTDLGVGEHLAGEVEVGTVAWRRTASAKRSLTVCRGAAAQTGS
ncbi:MAG: hypothetical protein JWR81_1146 [Pseudonocardia sp.]|jgi:hypothetical protein|nr:hypothetical protein [Pseudonocardia sp.]